VAVRIAGACAGPEVPEQQHADAAAGSCAGFPQQDFSGDSIFRSSKFLDDVPVILWRAAASRDHQGQITALCRSLHFKFY